MKSLRLLAIALSLTAALPAGAEEKCFQDRVHLQPSVPLSGKVEEHIIISSPFPPIRKGTRYYVLVLDRPICHETDEHETLRDVREIQLDRSDARRASLLKKYLNQHVEVQIEEMFRNETAWWQRDVGGGFVTIRPVPKVR
jgi:hypothetical protein